MLITVVSEAKVTLIYFAKESNLFFKKKIIILAVITMWDSPKLWRYITLITHSFWYN